MKHSINQNQIILLYSGRLIHHKGVQDLITTFKILNKEKTNLKLLIVGEGNFKNELKRYAQDITDDVIFIGHVDPFDIYKYYYASDIFVLPTHNDPWGLVVNEAMACGLPIIVTNAAGCNLDLVKDNGFVVLEHDINELYIAIMKLIDNDLRKSFSKKSRELINEWSYENSLNSFFDMINFMDKNGELK